MNREDYIEFLVNGIDIKFFNQSLIRSINSELLAKTDYALEIDEDGSWAIQDWERNKIGSFVVTYDDNKDMYKAMVFKEPLSNKNAILGKVLLIIMGVLYWWNG